MQIKIISWNVNGILACNNSGSFAKIAALNPDIIFLQETKTHQKPTILDGYMHVYNLAQRDGYSGTAVLYKKELTPKSIFSGFHTYPPDTEGRVITVELDSVFVVGAYFPNSQANLNRHDYRMEWDKCFYNHINELLWEKPVIICGDFNLVCSELDFFEENEREKFKMKGYITDEQNSFQALVDLGFKDVYRTLCPTTRSYTWWSNRLNKREQNRGWRLDYFLVSEEIFDGILSITHHSNIYGSDHCPIELHIEVSDSNSDYESATGTELEKQWNSIDWKAAEARLDFLQQQITFAAFEHDTDRIKRLQAELVRDLQIKCLAVRKVSGNAGVPGVDKVKWKTPAQKMAAALSLTSKNYQAKPFRQIHLIAKNNGKIRKPNLPTYYDRAMSVLYGYSLIPVTEAWSERKSFAFRPGRSTQDAHSYIMEALEKNNAPQYMVCIDVKGYYAHIHHDWILDNVPMDRKVLEQFLNAGFIFEGELFSASEMGISEGMSISPYIGNFVLDGLQKYIFEGLYGDNYNEKNIDYSNGNLIRFADDILVQARDMYTAELALEFVKEFLEKRGLTTSPEKTKICDISVGFTYLSRAYFKRNGVVTARPTEKAVKRFIADISETIKDFKGSQRELINLVNKKLSGWAGYHRCTDAVEAFHEVDIAVQTALLEAAMAKHPLQPLQKVQSKYWYQEPSGRHSYTLPNDKTVRVIWLEDTMLIEHNKLNTSVNVFLDKDKVERKTHSREIQNVTGRYKVVWERQGGRCYYCGRKILQDQPRSLVPLDLAKSPSVYNSAYIHKLCELNELEIIRTDEDISYLRPYDVKRILTSISEVAVEKTTRKSITPQWRYYPLKTYFQKITADKIALTFTQIEKIVGFKLPLSAKKYPSWWSHKSSQNAICDAWTSAGFVKQRVDIDDEKVYLYRDVSRKAVEIPNAILNGEIPENARIEVEQFCQYIVKKYGLKDK